MITRLSHTGSAGSNGAILKQKYTQPNTNNFMGEYTKRWMSFLDDRKLLSELTIPGTHDSCARKVGDGLEPFLNSVQTQTMTLKEQLYAGIRFFDIRCVYKKDDNKTRFDIYHGDFALYDDYNRTISFDDVLTECQRFLAENFKECIVMSVKRERDGDGSTHEIFDAAFRKYVAKNPSRWYTKTAVPQLKDVRGKIVLVRRFAAMGSGDKNLGFNGWSVGAKPGNVTWPQNNVGSIADQGVTLHIQDVFNGFGIGKTEIMKKYSIVSTFLETSAAGKDHQSLYINFTSAAGTPPPKAFAKGDGVAGFDGINHVLSQELSRTHKRRYGIIPMDFPEHPGGGMLIGQLILCNDFTVSATDFTPEGVYELHIRSAIEMSLTNPERGVLILSRAGAHASQLWKFELANVQENGITTYYIALNNAPHKVLAASPTNLIAMVTSRDNPDQGYVLTWQIEKSQDGFFRFKPVFPDGSTPMVLSPWLNNTGERNALVLAKQTNNQQAQEWKLYPNSFKEGARAVHRFYNQQTLNHFFSFKPYTDRAGYHIESAVFHMFETFRAGTVPLYNISSGSLISVFGRFPTFFGDSYTLDSTLPPGYVLVTGSPAITGYVYPPDIPAPEGTVKLFRWRQPSRKLWFYTTDPAGEYALANGYQQDKAITYKNGTYDFVCFVLPV